MSAVTEHPNQTHSVRVLVDRSVFSDAIVGEWVSTEHLVPWGNQVVKVPIVGMRLKPRLPSDQAARQAEISVLPSVAKLARDGRIELATYDELRFEEFLASGPVDQTLGDLFVGIDPLRVDPAVDRSFFQGQDFSKHVNGESIKRFCKFLLTPGLALSRLPKEFIDILPELSRKSLNDLDRFRALCRNAEEAQYRDLFHLWTAEVNGCSAFLTMEKKLPNFCKSHIKGPHCPAVRPRELLGALGVRDLVPMPIAEGEIVDYFRAMAFFPNA